MSYLLQTEFFQKYSFLYMNDRLSEIRSVHTYVWSKLDSCFCDSVYTFFFLSKLYRTATEINKLLTHFAIGFIFFEKCYSCQNLKSSVAFFLGVLYTLFLLMEQ